MTDSIKSALQQFPQRDEAEAILRRCVHCGFCNAVCPTYQLQGDERDGPRGRIYLLKQLFAGKEVTEKTQFHLDRCLTCRSCETTCPSGVQYSRVADMGRALLEQQLPRSWPEQILRQLLLWLLPYPKRFAPMIKLVYGLRPVLPPPLKCKLAKQRQAPTWPSVQHSRHVLLLEGCVQRSLAPHIDAITANVLHHLGISTLRQSQAECCGALHYHLNHHESTLDLMRQLIDACWPAIESGIEAIIMTASGCGVMLKDYGHLLAHDTAYAQKAARFSALVRDLSEVIGAEDLTTLKPMSRKIAFQSPCTLQHGQHLAGKVENILMQLGFHLTLVNDVHLCCGSAGTYSIFQPTLSNKLRANKLHTLQQGKPDLIATANIGCLLHLQETADVSVVHWIELLTMQDFTSPRLKSGNFSDE